MRSEPVEVRFWRRVDKSGDCWVWQGMKDASGYGRIQVGRVATLTHRVSWELANGAIPATKHVLHRCDNRLCVRPDHLFVGTNADNVADKVAKSRQRGAVGERNTKAKLTAEQVAEIRAEWRPGPIGRPMNGPSLTAQLAERYGVTKSSIYHVARGWTWKDHGSA